MKRNNITITVPPMMTKNERKIDKRSRQARTKKKKTKNDVGDGGK